VLRKPTAVAQVTSQKDAGYDLFFNLCDGAADEDTPGIEVVRALEAMQVPFTGATSDFYEPSREAMKAACRKQGIRTPDFVMAKTESDIARAVGSLNFPMFVKHPSSYASVGLTRASRVHTPADLAKQARRCIDRFGAALIEEYIDGIECTVLVSENPEDPGSPTTYQPMQYRFPEGEEFKHESLKWVDYNDMSVFPVEDPDLDRRLRDIAARFFLAIGGTSFGRCDIRVDTDGTPFILEINPNCGLYYPPTDPGSADLCLLKDPEGHAGFTRRIVEAALRRHRPAATMSPGRGEG
jgi:D-alanine-D-alanine ligase